MPREGAADLVGAAPDVGDGAPKGLHAAVAATAERLGQGAAVLWLSAVATAALRATRRDELVVTASISDDSADGETSEIGCRIRVTTDTRFCDVVAAVGAASKPGAGPAPARADVRCKVHIGASGCVAELRCDGTAMPVERGHRWGDMVCAALEHACEEPHTRIEELRLLTVDAAADLVAVANRGFDVYDDLSTVHGGFEAAARRHPDVVAVMAGAAAITYRELDERADAFAARLADLGVGPERWVGVCLDRSIDLVVALLGVLKAGAAFVPLDPAAPRRAVAIAEQGLQALVTEPGRRGLFDVPSRCVVTTVSSGSQQHRPAATVVLENAAYVYFTSGSTGTPKGVVIDHRCAAGRLRWLSKRYVLQPGDRVVQKTPLAFDVAVWEIFGPLHAGATVLLADPGREWDVDHIGELLSVPGTVFTHFVPSMLNAYLAHAPTRSYGGLQWVQTSGEPVSAGLLERFAAHFEAELHNLYGQTETSEVGGWEGRTAPAGPWVPIGRQIGIYRLFLLDECLQPVPPGVPGELCVAGVGGLARGYHDMHGLTAERFVPNPYAVSPGERLYRTGDLAVADAEGVITWLGRLDSQVKIRGCRVEPGEVEATLARHPAVVACAVVARPDPAGETELVAYVVGADVDDLVVHAEACLPTFMRPSVYVQLERLPSTPSGKLDRLSLPEPTPEDRRARSTGTGATTLVEERMCELWEDVLGFGPVGCKDNFFSLGGNSLQSLKLLNRVKATFGVVVTMRDFFRGPTVAAMAELVETELLEAVRSLPPQEATALQEGSAPDLRL